MPQLINTTREGYHIIAQRPVTLDGEAIVVLGVHNEQGAVWVYSWRSFTDAEYFDDKETAFERFKNWEPHQQFKVPIAGDMSVTITKNFGPKDLEKMNRVLAAYLKVMRDLREEEELRFWLEVREAMPRTKLMA